MKQASNWTKTRYAPKFAKRWGSGDHLGIFSRCVRAQGVSANKLRGARVFHRLVSVCTSTRTASRKCRGDELTATVLSAAAPCIECQVT